MRDRFKAIINVLRGRPVMYGMTFHIPEGWIAVSYGDIPNTIVRDSDNKGALIAGCTFMGGAAGIGITSKENS